jgi:hypothetical protein
MTTNEKLINIAGLTYILRDLLEDSIFDDKFEQYTAKYLKFLNKKIDELMSDDPNIWKEFDELIKHFQDNLIREEE